MTAFLDFLVAFVRVMGWVWATACLALGVTFVWFLFDGWRERRRGNADRASGRSGRIPPSRRLSGLPLDTRDAVALEQEHEPVEAGGQVVEGAEAILGDNAIAMWLEREGQARRSPREALLLRHQQMKAPRSGNSRRRDP